MANSTPFKEGMRDSFFRVLEKRFRADPKLIFITADNGAPTLDIFAKELGDQYMNVGIAEQQLFLRACGLALKGFRPFVYAIAPFVTTRPHEFVKLDVAAMNLPIVIIGVGAGYAYDAMGPSHHTVEDISIMRCLPNLKIYSPADSICAAAIAETVCDDPSPAYIRLDRAGIPDIYANRDADFDHGIWAFGDANPEVAIISTGIMVHQSFGVMKALQADGKRVVVVDVFRIKPFPDVPIWEAIDGAQKIVTIEEHFLPGGLGSIVAETILDNGLNNRLLRLGRTLERGYVFTYGGREEIWTSSGLDVETITKRIKEWL